MHGCQKLELAGTDLANTLAKGNAAILDRFPLVLEHVIGHYAGCPYQLGVGEVGPSKRGASLHFAVYICSAQHGELALSW